MHAVVLPRIASRPLAAAVVLVLVAAAPAGAADGPRNAAALDAGPLPPPGADRRLYVTGMIGSSVGQSTAGVAVPLVAGQGACGVVVPRTTGAVRLEFEARRRQPLATGPARAGGAAGAAGSSPALAEEWTTMGNVWRDLALTNHLGAYVGGGIGAGMRRPGAGDASATTGLGWQAGAGLTYAATDRVTFDAGYRFSGLEAAGPRVAAPGSELLFAVRIHEPFRGLRRDTGR